MCRLGSHSYIVIGMIRSIVLHNEIPIQQDPLVLFFGWYLSMGRNFHLEIELALLPLVHEISIRIWLRSSIYSQLGEEMATQE